MREMITKLTHGATHLLVLALGLGLVSTGWAGLVAEWNGDFDVTQKNGWTLTVGTGNTFANGVITIGASSTTPVSISHGTGYQRVTVVVGIKTSSSDTVGAIVSPVYGNSASPYAYLDVENSSSQIWYGWYNGTAYDDDWDKDNTVTWSNDSVQYVTFVADTATTSGEPRGSTIYHNGSVVDGRKNGLVSSSAYVKTIGVGGNPSRGAEGMLNGAVISYVAIYDAALTSSTTPAVASASVPDNLNLMYLISGNTIGTSGGVALANDAGYGDVVPTVWHSGYRNYASGKYGNASKLNGGTLGFIKNDGDGLGLNTSEGFTISFWANLASDLGNWRDFLAFRVGNVNCRFEKMDSNAFAMYSSGGTPFENVAYTVDTWSHYAVVFAPNNGGLKVYKDGTEVVSVTESVPSGTLYQVGMGQGRNGSDANSAFRTNDSPGNSLIDDLAIFKGALSASQISAIAASESAISGPVYGMYRTVSFATPQESVWATANLPNFAKTVTYGSGTVSFANDAYSKNTINNKDARVTSVVGGSFTEIDGYIKNSEVASTTTSDVYLKVSGDTTATRVNGMGETHWTGSGTRTLTGNVLVNLTGSAVVDYVMGAGYKGGTPTELSGNVGVVIDGDAIVKGTILGGWSSAHDYKPKISGSTYVLVKNVQGTNGASAEGSIPNGYIMGGSSYQTNYGRSWITQNTSVTVDLPNEATGTFVKGIVGGSYGSESNASKTTQIDGSSSVTITAPDAVTFSGNIIGGCWANSGIASVGGNASVTLNGGTYTGTIYAGGYGSGTPTVTGNATLTLNGGVYASATLKAGTATGTKSLVVNDDTDMSSSVINDSGFQELFVAANKTLTLGTKRLTGNGDPTLSSTSEGVVALTLTEAEYTSKYAVLLKCAASEVSGQYIIYYNNTDITSEISSKVSVLAGCLTYLDASSYESSLDAETTTDWDDVIWSKSDSSTDTMANVAASPTAQATLTLNGTLVIDSPVTFAGELLEIVGNGTIIFTGSAKLSAAVVLNIGSGIALDFSGLTNLTNMGIDTIISAGDSVSIETINASYPAGWTSRMIVGSADLRIVGAKQASDVISINIIGGMSGAAGKSIADASSSGLITVSGDKWNNVAARPASGGTVDISNEVLAERLADGSKSIEAGIVASIKASNTYAAYWTPPSDDLFYGYIDDGLVSDSKGAKITVDNIPYSEYAVLIYMSNDNDQSSAPWGCVYVNNTGYCGNGALTEQGTSSWGEQLTTHGTVTLQECSNYLRVSGLSGRSVTIQGSVRADPARGGIAGVQIVNTGIRGSVYSATLSGGAATLMPSGTSTGMTKTSSETWANNGEGVVYLTNPSDAISTVTIGENVSAKVFKIMGAGKVTLAIDVGGVLSISGGKIDLSEFSGTLSVDSTVSKTFFADVSTNGGTVRFLGSGLTFSGVSSLPKGRIAFQSATLSGDLAADGAAGRTIVVEDGDAVTLNGNNNSRTYMNFEVSGGSLTVASTGAFWFGIGSTFTQTGGTVTLASTASTMVEGDSGCVIFGYSSSGTTVSISHGTFDMSGAALCLWQPSSTLTLSGDAVFKAKAIRAQSGNAGTAVTIGGSSKLILTGTDGIFDTVKSLTMNGGTIEFQESATIAKALTLTSGVESTINIADTKSATISTVALSAVPAVGDKILATNGGTISVSAITAGGVAQELDLSYWSDGVYVAAAEYDSVNYPSVSAAIAVATDAHLADITLLNGCTTVPDGYYIDNNTVCKYQAAVVDGSAGVHYYTTAQAAVSAINTYALPPYYDHFEVYYGTAVAVSVNISDFAWGAYSVKIKCLNGATVSVVPNSEEYEFSAGEPDENSIVTYTKSEKATTYVWVGTGESSTSWDNYNKWKIGTSEGAAAARAPSTLDTVIINGGAPISISGVTVVAMQIGGEASIRGSGTLTATTGGIVLTDVGASITVSGVTLSPTPTTSVANHHVVNNAGVYSVALDQFAVTIPSVANTTVIVSYTSGGVSQTVTASGNISVDYGTDVTATWTAASGYKITAGASETLTAVASAQTLTEPTVEAKGATVSDVTFNYGNDFATATVTATVSGDATEYTLTVGGNNYAGSVSGSTVTFSNVATGHATAYDNVSYAITATDGTSPVDVSGGSGSVKVADMRTWIHERAASSTGASGSAAGSGGEWTTEVTYNDNVAAVENNTFTAYNCSTGDCVTATVNDLVYTSLSDTSDMSVIANDSQGAVALGETNVNEVTTMCFMILAKEDGDFVWKPATWGGNTPQLDTPYDIAVTFDYAAKKYSVCINGTNLMVDGATKFDLCTNKSELKSITFNGEGTLSSIEGIESTGYMVKAANGTYYATFAAAIAAYNADPTIGELYVLHDGTVPVGWMIIEVGGVKYLRKAPKGSLFIAF